MTVNDATVTSNMTSNSVLTSEPFDSTLHSILTNQFFGQSTTQANDRPASLVCLQAFSDWYQAVHGYVSLVVCIFGIAANLMNIVVLTQKNMITPTNCLLTALASADMLTMVSYLPYAVYFHCVSAPVETLRHPQGWVMYLLFHTYFIITSHTVSMWLTVALALFRYIVVCHHLLGPRFCNIHRAKQIIAATLVITVLFCVPNYVLYRWVRLDDGGYWFRYNDFVTESHKVFNFWLFGVVLKVAPCILLTVLSSLLIRAMKQAARRRLSLRSGGRRGSSDRAGDNDRTTHMLIVVVLSFVVTELPQGVLALLSGVDSYVFDNVYVPLGDVWDILVLINSSANFILYCIMSAQFRKTFRQVFCGQCHRHHHHRSAAVDQMDGGRQQQLDQKTGKNHYTNVIALQ